MNYVDPSGHFFETIFDIAFLVVDVYDFICKPSVQNAIFLVWSVAAVCLPVIPGSYAAKGINEAVKLIQKLTKTKKFTKITKSGKTGKKIKKGVNKATSVLKKAKSKVKKAGNAKRIIKSADNVKFNQKSIDKAFGKHGSAFGNYPDGSKSSVERFKKDVINLINTGTQKSGTWKGKKGTHIYNSSTRQWAFVNSDGTFNTAFKLSEKQYDYLIKTGGVQ